MTSIAGLPSQLLLFGYEGTELPPALRARVLRGEIAGLILFARNLPVCPDPSRPGTTQVDLLALHRFLCALSDEYLAAARDRFGAAHQPLPLIFSIDQEGGRVQRIKHPLPIWPPMQRFATQPVDQARSVGQAMGDELLRMGVNVNFAPVLDVNSNPHNPIIGDRAFGHLPGEAAARAIAYLQGLESNPGLRGCGKHFPGHGDTTTDSHHTLPVVPRDWATLQAVELAPFAAAIQAGLGLLMTAHVVYPAVDDRPATLSSRWLSDILRGQLGYQGVILSDDLDMRALAAEHLASRGLAVPDESQVIVEALLAGCDAFLLCRDPARQQAAEAALTDAMHRSPAVATRIHESLARLAQFRRTLATPTPMPPEHLLQGLSARAHALLTAVPT